MRADHHFEPIVTARLRLRRSVPEDAEPISVYRSDPDVHRMQGWERTDVVECSVGFSEKDVFEIEVRDAAGHRMHCDLLSVERYETGGIKRAALLFLARDVPSLGYEVYRILRESGPAPETTLRSNQPDVFMADVHRDMIENERSTAINPSEAVEEKVSLSDRFGLWLGFHNADQDTFFSMIEAYAGHYELGVPVETLRKQAVEWSVTRGARSGRVAWQFIQEVAGQLGKKLE